MKPFRLTIAGLMAVVLLAAYGFAALRNANALWASVTFTLALAALAAAPLGALAGAGPSRLPWAGFAAFAWVYLLAGLLPERASGGLGAGPIYWPSPLFEWGTASLQPYIHPWAAGSDEWVFYDQVSHPLGMIAFGLIGAGAGHLLGARQGDDRRG